VLASVQAELGPRCWGAGFRGAIPGLRGSGERGVSFGHAATTWRRGRWRGGLDPALGVSARVVARAAGVSRWT
jgi:hypothetical protein